MAKFETYIGKYFIIGKIFNVANGKILNKSFIKNSFFVLVLSYYFVADHQRPTSSTLPSHMERSTVWITVSSDSNQACWPSLDLIRIFLAFI